MIGKVRYVGKSFGTACLTNGNIYNVLGIQDGFIRVVDDSGEDYLYSITFPGDLMNPNLCGKWEIVEDLSDVLKDYIK